MKRILFFIFAFASNVGLAVAPKNHIEFDFPSKSGQELPADTAEITLQWHLKDKKVPKWTVELWCASDGECLYSGVVATNWVKVSGFKPNKVYYAKVARNWVRYDEITFSTGRPAAEPARAMPARFLDCAKYDVVEMPNGKSFDLGLTRFRGATRHKVDRQSKTEFIVTVPCEQYAKAWVLAKVDSDPKKDKAFNVRLTRHVNALWRKYRGRSNDSMANTLVEISSNPGEDLGGGFRLFEVPLKTGDIQDIVFTDNRGDFIEERGRYLDLEIMGRLWDWRNGTFDPRSDTDPQYTSAVTVYGVALEKPAAEFEVREVEPGNIFAGDEKPAGVVDVRIKRPGKYKVRLTVKDIDSKVVGTRERAVRSSGSYPVDFPHDGEGWYSLKWELLDGKRAILAHNAAFAVLGADTRTTEIGEQYGTWPSISRWGSHYAFKFDDTNNVERALEIIYKAGFRRAWGACDLPLETRRRWKIGESVAARFPNDWDYVKKGGESNLVAVIERRLAENPHCKVVNMFHEHAPLHGPAPEIFGFEPDAKRLAHGKERAKEANMYGSFLRKNFPDLKILLGNSLASGEFIAELLRNGFRKEYADYIGLEIMGNETLPEYQNCATIQSAELMQLVAKKFGCDKWGVNQCFESNYCMSDVSGPEGQASYYVRYILLSYLWGFPDIYLGSEADTSNHYSMSAWGNIGFCSRLPFMYPKPSYVAVATATKLLDRVTGVRKISTGDNCAYAVEFTRRDGKAVVAFWASRGDVEFGVDVRAPVSMYDIYGRSFKFKNAFWAGERIKYLVGSPNCVKSVSVLARRFPADKKPSDYTAVVKADNVADWTVAAAPLPQVENDFMKRGWPHRTLVPARLSQVDDPEMGRCIELELLDDGKSVADPHYRYNAFMLKNPIPVGRDFKSVGCTIKGNSGWGDIHYILSDAKGRRTISCDVGAQGKLDNEGRSAVSFTGWNFMRLALKPGSSVHELHCNRPLWNWTDTAVASGGDLQIVGLVFSARMKPLCLNEARAVRQVIRLKDIGVFD